MKFAFVFPGQGSQSVGMLDAFSACAAVRETLDEAADVLNQDIGKLIAEGPAAALNLTVNTQPVMLTAAYAIYRAWRAAGGPAPAMVAGHSLGEYTALVTAGAMTFRDALLLVRFRAQAMQAAAPAGAGAMAAIIGLDKTAVCALCEQVSAIGAEVVEAVNFNAQMQIVIAGHRAAVNTVCERALAKGAKRALPLPVSAPFHSSLLEPASERLRKYLAQVEVRAPCMPVVNNIDVAAVSEPAGIREALARQASGPVRWLECVQAIARAGVALVAECGPGKVLAGLTKRIDNTLASAAVFDPASLDAMLARVQSSCGSSP